jgi:hypothetical protein
MASSVTPVDIDQFVLDSDDDSHVGKTPDHNAANIHEKAIPSTSFAPSSQLFSKHDKLADDLKTKSGMTFNNPKDNPSRISNTEILHAIHSIDAKIKKIEEAIQELTRHVCTLTQSNPTFISSGNKGPINTNIKGTSQPHPEY